MDNISIYSRTKQLVIKFLPLIILAVLLIVFFSFNLQQYVSFSALQQHHQQLTEWTAQYYYQVVGIFLLVYILAVAISIPGAIFLTLAGGFLFGPVWGSIFVVFSATIGATLLYLAVRLALADWMAKKTASRLAQMRDGFHRNAFSYLMVLRLIPLFPFWLVNIVPALLNVPLSTFFLATLIGIIPGSVVYVTIGNGLSVLFAMDKTPDLGVIFQPAILLPLIGLALLSLLPVVYNHYKGKKNTQQHTAANQDKFD